MIEVELKTPAGEHGYGTVARLTVYEDGSYEAWDPDGRIPWGIHALRPQSEDGLQKVHFESEPIEWARRLNTILRTGYLVPVTVYDEEGEQRSPDVRVRVQEWRDGWELHVQGVGVTQVTSLADPAQQVVDYVATVSGRVVAPSAVVFRGLPDEG